MRETLIEVLDDDARIVEDKITIYERGHAVVRIEIEQILGEVAVLDIDDVDGDALLRKHEPRAVAPWIERF
jgi:hypothetical protein